MNDKQFQKEIDKAITLAIKHRKSMQIIGDECLERYGYHYSDLDLDEMIDAVNYGTGYITVEQIKDAFKSKIGNKNDN